MTRLPLPVLVPIHTPKGDFKVWTKRFGEMWDDQQPYFDGLVRWIQAVDAGRKRPAPRGAPVNGP